MTTGNKTPAGEEAKAVQGRTRPLRGLPLPGLRPVRAATNQNYSSRASAAAYSVAEADTTPDKQAFRRFHAGFYAQQPSETGTTLPTNAQLIEIARQAGIIGAVPDCINEGRHLDMARVWQRRPTSPPPPTVQINGEDYTPTTPDALIKQIVG